MSGHDRAAFPHCDTRVLHAPGECEYCDRYDDWQQLRELWGIAFTGHAPQQTTHSKQLPCPADYNRPPDSPSDHRQWPGNTPTGYPPVDIEALTEAMLSMALFQLQVLAYAIRQGAFGGAR